MSHRPLSIGDLDRLLRHIGLQASTTSEGYRVYLHIPSDTRIFLPRGPESASSLGHLTAIRHQLIWRGVIEEDAFDDLLREIGQMGDASNVPAATSSA